MQGFVFNLRRPIFQDRKVRQALAYAFDFEWTQQDAVLRPVHAHRSYFSKFGAGGDRPAAAEELEILEPLQGPDSRRGVHHRLSTARRPTAPATPATILRRPSALLEEAGWRSRTASLSTTASRSSSRSCYDPAVRAHRPCPSSRTWSARHRGARAHGRPRAVPARIDEFDFDMTVESGASRCRRATSSATIWGSKRRGHAGQPEHARHQGPGGRRAGRDDHRRADARQPRPRSRALDRVLQWGYYFVPHCTAARSASPTGTSSACRTAA